MKIIPWLNWIKVLGAFMVVLLHVNTRILFSYDDLGLIWWFSNLTNSATRWAVPIFVMASGALLLSHDKLFPLQHFFKKRFLKILIPTIFWSLIYILFYQFVNPYGLSISLSDQLFNTIVKGRPAIHMWFLFMMIGMYIVTPLFYYFIDNATKSEIKLVLIFSFIVSFIVSIKNRFFGNDLQLWITLFLYYAPYFIIGRYIFKNKLWNNYSINKILPIVIVTYLINVFGSYLLQLVFPGKIGLILNSDLSLTIAVISISIFMLFPKISLFQVNSKLLEKLSSTILGVYIIHPIIIYAFYRIGISTSMINPILSVPLVAILVYITSAIIILILKKIPWIKYCV